MHPDTLQGQQSWVEWEERSGILNAVVEGKRDEAEKAMRRGREMYVPRRGEEIERKVISGDLRSRSFVEVCAADRSVMDFRMC